MLLISQAEFAVLITVSVVAAACFVGIVVLSIWVISKLRAKKQEEAATSASGTSTFETSAPDGAEQEGTETESEEAVAENAQDVQDFQDDQAV